MLSKTLSSLLILAAVLVLPLIAQTPATTTTANQTMGTNPAASKSTKTEKKVTKVEKTETKTETKVAKTEHKKTTKHHATSGGHAYDYATRLASLLADTQDKAALSGAAWKSIANEANALANKLYASTSGKWRTDAKEARTHVRLMHEAAMKGDADGAKSHAGMALPYVYKIIDATGPKK